MSPSVFYSDKKDKYSKLLVRVSAKLKRFAWYRLLAFLLIFTPLFVFGFSWATIAIGILFLVLFLYLVKQNIQLEKDKNKYVILKKLSEDELLALNHEYDHFENGKEFLNTDHFFSYDLDLFGEGSLFQFINRTSTQSGREKIAGWIMNPLIKKSEIVKRQQAVDELSKIPEWRLYFLSQGHLFKETAAMNTEVRLWSEKDLELKNSSRVKWFLRIIPALTILSIIPAAIGITNIPLYTMILVQWILLASKGKLVGYYFNFFGRKSQLIEKYVQLLRIIEECEFHSEYLIEQQRKIKEPETASHIFNHLKNHMKEFEYRQNIIVGFILNSLFLWDIRNMFRLWRWHQKHRKKLLLKHFP